MSEFASVLELARAVTKAANRISDDAEVQLRAAQVLKRVDEVTEALGQLDKAVTAARRLAVASGTDAVSLTGLDEGRQTFARNADKDLELPSNLAFTNAKSKINAVTQRVSAELAIAWTQWTDQEMAKVPKLRIPLLGQEDQRRANDRWADLVKTARVATPTVTDIIALKSALDYLHEELALLPDPPGEVLAILGRLGQRRGVTLAELTDGEIAVLRAAGVADQIEVRRRGA
jgi:hypothetical protein